MKVNRQDFFVFFYIILIGITVFAPEQFGTPLRYGIIPLIMMVLFATIRTYCGQIRGGSLLFLLSICISTFFSTCQGVEKISSNFRSVCLLIIFFIILAETKISEQMLNKIKTWYILFSVFCGLWVVGSVLYNGLANINRYKFEFIWGLKDVNYLLAFMLPGCYMAFRRLAFEKTEKKIINVLCVFSVIFSVLVLETRASFITIIIVIAIMAFEYFYKDGMSTKKVMMLILMLVAMVFIGIWIFSTPAFSRLTSVESYEDNIRLVIWAEALKGFFKNVLFGSGLGSASYYSVLATHYQSHNNYLDILCDFGIVGTALFLMIIVFLFKVPKGKKIYMLSYAIAFLLPLAFINGFQTLVFWVPMLLLVHEKNILNQ